MLARSAEPRLAAGTDPDRRRRPSAPRLGYDAAVTAAESGLCANCGAGLAGRFCHRCGQEAVELRVPLRRLLADALGDLLAFDSRIARTAWPLVARPGLLTAEWCRGRRVAFVPPLRLYVFVAALFFLVMAVTDASVLTVSTRDAEGAAAGGAEAAARGAPPPDLARVALERLAAAWERDQEGLQDLAIDRMGRLSLLLAPLSALVVAMLYRRRRYLVEHVVFTLHFHAFAFLLLTLVLLLPEGGPRESASPVAVAVLAVYLFLALRRVYGGRAWATALRTAAFGALYLLVVFLPTLFLTLAWVVWSAGAS